MLLEPRRAIFKDSELFVTICHEGCCQYEETDILKHLYTSQDIKDSSRFKSYISSSHILEIMNICEFVLASLTRLGVRLWVCINHAGTVLIVRRCTSEV